MRESIEDRIIAYFDGRMSDDESADLLHRVSVSPEIRKLFREHGMLRELARSAQASTVVRPELEASLLTRIEALAAAEAPAVVPIDDDRRKKAVPLFWTRWRLGLAIALGAFVLGTAITLGPELFDGNGSNDLGQRSVTDRLDQSSGTDAPQIVRRDDIITENDLAPATEGSSKTDFNKIIRGDRNYEARQVLNERPEPLGNSTDRSYTTDGSYRSQENAGGANNVADNTESVNASASDVASIAPISAVAAKSILPVNLGGEKGNIPVFRAEDIERDEANFEAALETSSGFSYPANGPNVQPFADHRISFGYFLDPQNIVGVRFTSGLFQTQPETSVSTNAAYTSVSRNLEQDRLYNFGAYYTHREFGVLSDLISFDATLGAGSFLTSGYTVSAEIGLRMPLSSRVFMGASFGLHRVHLSAPSMEEVANRVSVGDGPVLIEGSNIQNTINGRIHYGLSYQF